MLLTLLSTAEVPVMKRRGMRRTVCSAQCAVRTALPQCTEVRFASFLSGGFITAIVVNPPEMKLAKRTSVQWYIV